MMNALQAYYRVRRPPLDGISLTVNEVAGEEFGVFIIPHTLAVTNWKAIKPGAEVNLEVDLMARYAARLAEKSPG